MAKKYIARIDGKNLEVEAIVTSAPDEIVATDNTGKLDISLMPVGVGAEVRIALAFEDLTGGNFVNGFSDGGVFKFRKADATTSGKPAYGFVLASVTAGNLATVYGLSNTNTQLAGLTVGADYYLSTTPGAVMIAPGPVASGNLSQQLGVASKATELVFDGPASAGVELA